MLVVAVVVEWLAGPRAVVVGHGSLYTFAKRAFQPICLGSQSIEHADVLYKQIISQPPGPQIQPFLKIFDITH